MRNKSAIYGVFIKQTVFLIILTVGIGMLFTWLINLMLEDGYAFNSLSFIVIINLLVMILQKGMIGKELTSFMYSRRLILSINICSDVAVSLTEGIILGGVACIAINNPSLNERLRILDMEKVQGMASAGQYFMVLFGIALLTQAILTVDAMRNCPVFGGFFVSSDNKKQGVISFVAYIATAIVMGFLSATYMDLKEPVYRYGSFLLMVIAAIFLYIIAKRLSRKKQYTT